MSIWQRLKDQVATLDRELKQYRLREREKAAANEVKESVVSPEAAGPVPLACSAPVRTVNIVDMRAAGKHCPSADTCLSSTGLPKYDLNKFCLHSHHRGTFVQGPQSCNTSLMTFVTGTLQGCSGQWLQRQHLWRAAACKRRNSGFWQKCVPCSWPG